jgi:hypothetical protein
MMINHSLKVLTEDIKGILRNSVVITDKTNNKYLPIYFDKDVSSSCRDKYVEDEVFEVFNTSEAIYKPTGIIMKTIGEKFGVDLNNLNFVVLNIINVSDSWGAESKKPKKVTNNPPTPPYINLTNLIYNLPISHGAMQTEFNSLKIKKEYYELRNRLEQFNFYKNSVIFTNDIMKFKMKDEEDRENILSAVKKLLDLVRGNNPSTLIGSMETLEMLQSNIKFLCSNNKEVKYDEVTFQGLAKMTDKFEIMKEE